MRRRLEFETVAESFTDDIHEFVVPFSCEIVCYQVIEDSDTVRQHTFYIDNKHMSNVNGSRCSMFFDNPERVKDSLSIKLQNKEPWSVLVKVVLTIEK